MWSLTQNMLFQQWDVYCNYFEWEGCFKTEPHCIMQWIVRTEKCHSRPCPFSGHKATGRKTAVLIKSIRTRQNKQEIHHRTQQDSSFMSGNVSKVLDSEEIGLLIYGISTWDNVKYLFWYLDWMLWLVVLNTDCPCITWVHFLINYFALSLKNNTKRGTLISASLQTWMHPP